MIPAFFRTRTFITSNGLGDVLMAIYGLHALCVASNARLSKRHALYVKAALKELGEALLEEVSVRASSERPKWVPVYQIFSNTSWTKTLKNLLSWNIYNNFTDRRAWVFGQKKYSLSKRLCVGLNSILLDGRLSWRRETPVYYGLKMWAPYARSLGLCEVELLNALHRSMPVLRERMRSFAASKNGTVFEEKIAFFPCGRSFQYAPPEFIKRVVAELGCEENDYCCFFSPGDEAEMKRYEQQGLKCRYSASIEEVLSIVVTAQVTVTVDSFVGHLAQVAANHHVLLLSRELPEEVVHPAAVSHRVFEAMTCAPCHYEIREKVGACPADRKYCGVFDSTSYREQAVRSIRYGLM